MDDLYSVIDNIDKDNSFDVIEILKENRFEKTEKVRALNGREYIRKYFFHEGNYSKEKLNAISRLKHPNLPDTHDCYELADSSVIIQNYIKGKTLTEFIDGCGIDASTMTQISIAICDAVEYMHMQTPDPLIHRDIKPDNIIVETDGFVKLVDFGAVRVYKKEQHRDTVYVGTPGYASPEQFGFGQTDKRTDIYAIGMTMRHMLTGKPPERDGKYDRPVTTNELTEIIDKATEFDPEKRYNDAGELKNALKSYYAKIRHKPTMNKKRTAPGSKYKPIFSKSEPSKRKNIYPKYLNLPYGIKIGLIPVHLLIIIFLIYAALSNIVDPSGFGFGDDLIATIENIAMVIALTSCYMMGFNLFNITTKFKLFHKKKILKIILISLLLLTIAGMILDFLEPYHSDAYNLAHSAGS